MAVDYDLVIVGGSAAGLTAGLYAARARLKTVLLEKQIVGGQLVNADSIENYPGFPDGIKGIDLVMAMESQAAKFGLEERYVEVTGLQARQKPIVVETTEDPITAKAVIIASGGEHKKLGVPGEADYEARGVSYCATCDGNFFMDQEIAVVGGGNAALDEGLYLTNLCKQVTVIHRRDQLRASKILQERALENPKMKFVWNTVVQEIKGNGQVERLVVKNLKTGQQSELPVSGIFIYVGFTPATQWLEGALPMDPMGHIKVDLWMRTEVPGVFAAGDCRWQSASQWVTACGDGCTAAIAAHEYITEAYK